MPIRLGDRTCGATEDMDVSYMHSNAGRSPEEAAPLSLKAPLFSTVVSEEVECSGVERSVECNVGNSLLSSATSIV